MPPRNAKGRRKKEILGIVAGALAVFVALSLVSYHALDPSLNTALSPRVEDVNNWGGIVGAYLSDLLFQAVGFVAFSLPIFLLWMSWKLVMLSEFRLRYVRVLGYVLFFMSGSALFHLMWAPGEIHTKVFHYDLSSGGATGSFVGQLLERYLNTFGAATILVLAFLLSFLLITDLSFRTLVAMAGKGLQGVGGISLGAAVLCAKGAKGLYEKSVTLVAKSGLRSRQTTARRTVRSKPQVVLDGFEATPGGEGAARKGSDKEKVAALSRGVEEKVERAPGPPGPYVLPSVDLLDSPEAKGSRVDKGALEAQAKTLEGKLADFGIHGSVAKINPGPYITRFDFEPGAGIKINRIVSLADDLALALKALNVRILAPIPGEGTVGIEIPNRKRELVSLREIITREEFLESPSKLTLALGKDTSGRVIISDLCRMPHLLIAGATGTGKSVCLNAMISTVLFRATPDEVRMLLIDPKRLELSGYDGIPHNLHPVVTDPKKANLALRWMVEEMERRYQLLAEVGARDIDRYNQRVEEVERQRTGERRKEGEESPPEPSKLPYILVVIDELADLMMVSSREVESSIARLAQMARAAGIHLLVATQRPSVDILTGPIKNNFPARVSFKVPSKVDSRTILDTVGGERLLGDGDMLFLPPGSSKLQRIHGAFLSEAEIMRVVAFWKDQVAPVYDESILEPKEDVAGSSEDGDCDEKYDEAVALVADIRQASISMLQRRLRVGYNRAARMIEKMEEEGVVGPSDGVKPREVLVGKL